MGLGPVFPLTLPCQLNVPEPVGPACTIGQRIRKRGDVETFAEKLTDSTQKMSTFFPQSQLLEDHVQILVELPSSELMAVMMLDHRHYYIQ